MRADSRAGRIIGALACKASSPHRGIPRSSAVGRIVGALARVDSGTWCHRMGSAPSEVSDARGVPHGDYLERGW